MDRESFTQTYDEYIAKLSSGRVLGMADQWWDFAYSAGDAIKTAGLDKQGCEYIPLPITIDEGVKNQWHNSGGVLDVGKGLAITVSCEDVEGALQFVNDLLDQEIHDLRYWGVEGTDYLVDDDGVYYCTDEMRAQGADAAYKASHLCVYAQFPQWNGTSRDGINAMQPKDQEVEFYDGLRDDVKECFEAYGVKTYVEMLGKNEAPGAWFPMWSHSNNYTTDSDAGMAWAKIGEVKHEYLPKVVMADDFDSAWKEYMGKYKDCKPEDFLNDLQEEANRRMKEAEKYK